MGKSVIKDIIREIRKSFGRFLAIFAIVAIGVAFFAGVTASSSDMRNSADSYFDKYNLMDVRLLSSIGFNQDDISAIRATEGVKGVFATHSLDALIQLDSTKSATKIMTVPLENQDANNEDYINQLRIKEGRLPEKSGECVVKYETVQGDPIKIGDKITLQSGTDEDILQTLKNSEYEVVGIVYTPYYLSYEMGATAIGNGKISHCIMIPDSDFISSYYTEVFATVDGAKAINAYDDAYFDVVDKTTEKLENISKSRIEQRIEDIKDQINLSVTNQLKMVGNGDVREDILAQQIKSAQNDALANSTDWQWYVLDRNSHFSYRDYGQCANQMDSIATIFPIFFFFVASLVCLTTMTRMVDEQRGTIGTFKALGYSKSAIALKYISYALIASILGGIVGCIIGLNIFPRVIYTSWNIVYELPEIQLASHKILILVSILSMAGITTLAAFAACSKELAEEPSMLMRPKAPKKGKKILLERLTFIWKRMKFTQKVTARNIFRYKKRFVMTLIGIAGCTALLLAGFGIKDSIAGLIDNQYKQILKYNVTISYPDNIPDSQHSTIINDIHNDSRFTNVLEVSASATKVNVVATEDSDHKDIVVNFISINNLADYSQFITFRARTSHKSYELKDDGVIISEKLSNDLNVKAGDDIYIENKAGVRKQVKISHIMETYVNHYVFISDAYYEQIFGEKVVKNEILGILSSSSSEIEDKLGNEYLNVPGITSITFFTGNINKFNKMIQSLDLVTYVLIISAAMLAFVVLYNLTNVNISERLREIATIKVLGFYDKEVASYVYRENIMITIIGALVGLGLGVVLHGFIMKTVEMDAVMFGSEIKWPSFAIAFIMTVVFSLLINLAMNKKLRNIQMVESLKSVE